jgi:ribose/xylose/arabinose/galactoside ABC-type transport system permease subunit
MSTSPPAAPSGTAPGPGAVASPEPRVNRIGVLFGSRFGPFIGVGAVLILLCAYMAATEPVFSSGDNLTNLMRSMAVPLVLAGAMALVLLTGGVDLSMGATLALTGTLYAKLVTDGAPAGLALIACIAFGAALGFCVNGILIGRLDMSFFVVTLGTLSAYRGLTFLWTDSTTIDMFGDSLSQRVGDSTVLGDRIPFGILIALGVVVLLYLVLRFTNFGRAIYAVGGNKEAAELSGVRSGWVIAAVYGISGACAALAAVMTIGRSTIADPNMGTNIELQVAAAALLGGVALSGGVGSIWGAVLGVVFFQVLSNSLSLIGAPQSWQLIVTGVILVVAIYLDRVRSRVNRATQ